MHTKHGVGCAKPVFRRPNYYALGAYTTNKISEEERMDVVRHGCPGPGACGGMYT